MQALAARPKCSSSATATNASSQRISVMSSECTLYLNIEPTGGLAFRDYPTGPAQGACVNRGISGRRGGAPLRRGRQPPAHGTVPTEPDHQEAGKTLGADLFERNTRAVSLTAAGLSFLRHARKILEELDLARRAATTESGTFYGRLGIGFSGALNQKTLPPLTRALRHRFPELALTLPGGFLTQDALNLLHNGSLDCPS